MSLTREQRIICVFLGILLISAMPSFWMSSSSGDSRKASRAPRPAALSSGEGSRYVETSWTPRRMTEKELKALEESMKVDINTADDKELDSLPGVGPTTAAGIIAYREANGSFASIDELRNIKGIGQSTFDKLRDKVKVSGDAAARPRRAAAPDAGGGARTSAATGKININTASLEELKQLTGVGDKTAQDILDHREKHGRFKKPEDLMDVKGIGEGKFAKMRDRVTVR